MATYGFDEARACVIGTVSEGLRKPQVDKVKLLEAAGRVLAADISADRDYPPVARSVRDGFAVRAADVPGDLVVAGEIRAGASADRSLGPGDAIEIMTGAPMPAGADAVAMVEHTTRTGDRVTIERALSPGENYNEAGIEARAGEVVVAEGSLLGYAEIAMAATVGRSTVSVYRRPRVAILATGDELVDIDAWPEPWQVRNSNASAAAVQVSQAGGDPYILPVASDTFEHTRELLELGLESDLLLISGGVSAGKYDFVEKALAGLGAEFFFDRVRIQPGQPLVFGRARGVYFFGLPGNPVSGMVTFQVFARAALELLSGRGATRLTLLSARLAMEFRQKPGLTRFIPARLSEDGSAVTPAGWHGSGDVPATVRADGFMVTAPDRETYAAGDLVRVLLK